MRRWQRSMVVGAGGLALHLACSSNGRDFGAASAGDAGASGSPNPGNDGEGGEGGAVAGGGAMNPDDGVGGESGGASGTSATDPCSASMTCDSPPGEKCDGETRVVYAQTGTCEAGVCSYESTLTPCAGATPKCLDDGATTKCVGCLGDGDCEGSTPVCDSATDKCMPRPSCNGLAANCGPNGDEDCCASSKVAGGNFYRGYDAATHTDKGYPATVSDYRLDNYEITVGRFRKFVAAYSQDMIKAGAGANPNNAADTGWDTAWNAALPLNAAALTDAIKCDGTYMTWTIGAGANETRPLNCISWYEAQAFCIWDGGRLPTEAEWNYAATGGTETAPSSTRPIAPLEQRIYPWGGTAPGANAKLAVYGCYFNGSSTCSLLDIAPVGSVREGNGKYGQSDLAGNLSEWVQDWDGFYPTPCTDCASLTPGEFRAIRGGSFEDAAQYTQASTRFDYSEPAGRWRTYGARCARTSNL